MKKLSLIVMLAIHLVPTSCESVIREEDKRHNENSAIRTILTSDSKTLAEEKGVLSQELDPEKEVRPKTSIETPIWFVRTIAEFENYPLSSKPVDFIDSIRVDYLSTAKVREIGYGFTNDGFKDAARRGFLKAGTTIPTSMPKGTADEILADVIIPTYGSIVDQVVTVPLNSGQRLALISFTFNLGEGNLRKLVSGPGRLNSGDYESIKRLLPLYVKAGGKTLPGLQRRRSKELEWWNAKF